MKNIYINIKDVAEAKGLKSTRSLRLELNKPESKYISREVQVNGGTSYEILFSSLEPELQDKLRKNENKSTELVPLNYQPQQFVSDNAKITANFRINIVLALIKFRKKYMTKKQADSDFLDLYNSGLYLPKAYRFIGAISIGTLHRWLRKYEKHECAECLQPNYKYTKQGEYNSILNDEMRQILLTLLLHPSKYNYGKAIKLTKEILKKRGYEHLPCDLSFKRYAENFRKNNYAEWVLRREGMKAYHDKVEPYIERDISKIEVGDVIVADGHVLNFQVINPFTGRPTRATLVGFLDWKSTALVGYEIMMTESTQCIASALRNAIINLGLIPKVVYQDNGKAFKSRFFQNVDFEEDLFNGVYANLNIHSVFAKPYNARAKVIERFFREFQEELEKGMPSYIGTSIEDKPAWLKRGEKLHAEWHKKLTNNHIPTVSEASKYINSWIEFHNNQPCPNDKTKTIKECLNSVQKQNIDVQRLDDLMMKTEGRTINKHGITFLNMHYRSEAILGIRDKVNIRYSLFDLSKIFVYSTKGEFLCVANRVRKVHPMARVLGTVKDMEEYKYQYEKQQKLKNKLVKQIKKTFPKEELRILEIEPESVLEIEQIEPEKTVCEHKLTPREKQMNKPLFDSDFEKYEWLMNNGCTNPEDRKWLADYIRSDEYYNLYGG
ncbi:MAG: Mu transposase C-terminal domain-containing protein [Cyanobacteriota bacterium]|nr:Mu transposase C-terminal domain-containing protein [Cyanobacteriota bacterium]